MKRPEWAEILERSQELRILHTKCTGSQKVKVVRDRLLNPDALSNIILTYYSAIEALCRFILMRHDKNQNSYADYRSLKTKKMMDTIRENYKNIFINSEENEMFDEFFACFSEVRNYLVHECGFIQAGYSKKILCEAKIVIQKLENIISE